MSDSCKACIEQYKAGKGEKAATMCASKRGKGLMLAGVRKMVRRMRDKGIGRGPTWVRNGARGLELVGMRGFLGFRTRSWKGAVARTFRRRLQLVFSSVSPSSNPSSPSSLFSASKTVLAPALPALHTTAKEASAVPRKKPTRRRKRPRTRCLESFVLREKKRK